MNKKAYYGQFGGQYVAESLMNTLQELDQAYEEAIHDPEFMKQYHYYLKQYVGRETPLYYAERLSAKYGTKIYLKREDLNHTGAHKINNVIGQILLAKRMGKTKVIAETGAGQHGVATATGAALFDMECTVYMGKEDIQRQKLNVMRMEMLGAKVVSVESGSNTLKDATNEAIRTWAKTAEDTFYIIGSAVGPYPYPKMVKEFQSVISREAKRQHMEAEGKNPDVVMACVGGGSNSIGMFADFIDEPEVELIGVEALELRPESMPAPWLWESLEYCMACVRICCRIPMEISSWHTPFPPDWIIRESDRSMHICGIPDVQNMWQLRMWRQWMR